MALSIFGNQYLLQKIANYLREEFDEGLFLCCRTVYNAGYPILRHIHISAQISVLKHNKTIVFNQCKPKGLISRTYGQGGMDIHQIGRYNIEVLIVDKNATLNKCSGLNMNAISIILVTRLSQVMNWPTNLRAVLLSRVDEITNFNWANA